MLENGVSQNSVIELSEEIFLPGSVSYNSDTFALTGAYGDELSIYRARKVWREALENCFLLNDDGDLRFEVHKNKEAGQFLLHCYFLSACARYAFWRLTNHHAPEAEYMIETGHVPSSKKQRADFLAAPDMKNSIEAELERMTSKAYGTQIPLINKIKDALSKLVKD